MLFFKSKKREHIRLAQCSITLNDIKDNRFYYEPMLSSHTSSCLKPKLSILNKSMQWPIWISSMTGGTSLAKKINMRLAKCCKHFGLGMGLGSCRVLLNSEKNFKDFDLRHILGDNLLFFANLGIAQIEKAVCREDISAINNLVQKLNTDGLIIHVNPIQEFLQPEGDRFKQSPLVTIKKFLQWVNYPIIVKEVGQGIGPKSLRSLLQLPLAAIELAGFGGTNFALLESLRRSEQVQKQYLPIIKVGHSAEEMITHLNYQKGLLDQKILCKHIIISGGIQSFLDGYYLIGLSKIPAVYGQAGKLLTYAQKSYKALYQYLTHEIMGLNLAYNYLKIKGDT